MPTYYACGVIATLATCDLESSLSYDTTLRQGVEQQRDTARMRNLLLAADKLCERPISAGGSDKGIVQFIGVDEDMPLYMVEASPEIDYKHESVKDVEMEDAQERSRVDSANDIHALSDDSPLTSLGATPSPVTPIFKGSPRKDNAYMQLTVDAVASLEDVSTLKDRIEAVRTLKKPPTFQALVLDVQLSDKSFLPEDVRSGHKLRTTHKDLKIEVFLNGELADVAFIHGAERRRAAVKTSADQIRFSGTRIHRQVEKPWIYSREVTAPDTTSDLDNNGERRWKAVSEAHVRETAGRGRDKLGRLPPSASFLAALADLAFPQRMKDHLHLGIVDLVVTAGMGRKYGPETFYLTKPTRMDDRKYLQPVILDSEKETALGGPSQKAEVQEDQNIYQGTMFNSNHTPEAPSLGFPSPGTTLDLKKELDPRVDVNKLLARNYENAQGVKGKSGRTLQQWLGDLKKMNAANLERDLGESKHEFGDKGPSPKKTKLADDMSTQPDVLMSNPLPSTEKTTDPTKLVMKLPPALRDGIDPEAVLAQSRIDIALEKGAASDGPLLRRIASTSPQRTPEKVTKASALAGSPKSTTVKTPRRASYTPNLRRSDAEGPTYSKQARLVAAKVEDSPSRPPNAKKVVTPRAKPAEQQISEALDAFRIPETCQGSCASYKEDVKVSRQIGKVRGGEFKEETLLVGMRFVVL